MTSSPIAALRHGCRAATVAALVVASATAQESPSPTHGWRRSSPEAQGMRSAVLAEAFDYVRQHRIPIHSLTIVRHGYIVLDAYFWPFEDGQLHDLASVTKSVTSTLIGVAIGRRQLSGVDQPLLPLFGEGAVANRDERKGRITLEHLLTMTSGLDCVASHEVTLFQMMQSGDWIRFALDRPMAAEPGQRYVYCSPGMHLLSGVITRATGSHALDYARRELFGPLGIDTVVWPSDPQGNQNGWGDLHLQPRDMAKLGYLWLHDGRWEDRQIVPAAYLHAATLVHSHPGFTPGQEYGYGFWIYPQRTPPIFEGIGRGGQRISVVPAQDLVVVFTGGTFEPGDVGDFIGRAIASSAPLPEDTAGAARLAAAIEAAARPPAAEPVPPLPLLATAVSGRHYALDVNPLGVKGLSLSFAGGAEAELTLELADGTVWRRPVGLDAIPRLSPDGRFGLPVAASGRWDSDSSFVLDYDEVGNVNAFRLGMTFAGSAVTIEMSERSGLFQGTRIHGRAIE